MYVLHTIWKYHLWNLISNPKFPAIHEISRKVSMRMLTLEHSWLKIFHEYRSLAGYSLWSHKELDMTEHSCNCPLQLPARHVRFLMLRGKQVGEASASGGGNKSWSPSKGSSSEAWNMERSVAGSPTAPGILWAPCGSACANLLWWQTLGRSGTRAAPMGNMPNTGHMTEALLVIYPPAKPPAECSGGMSKPEETAEWFRPQTHN